MGFQDEEILKFRNSIKIKEKIEEEKIIKSIYDEKIMLFDEETIFKESKILDKRAKIIIPTTFSRRSQEEIKAIYTLGNAPQYLYANDDLPLYLSFTKNNNKITEEEIKGFNKIAKSLIERVGPKSNFTVENTMITKNTVKSILEFTVNNIIDISYCIMFYMSFENQLLIGNLTFNNLRNTELLNIAREIVASFYFIEEDEK